MGAPAGGPRGLAAEPLADAAWLAGRLHDPDLLVLQVDEDAGSYYVRHVPGAQPLDWQDELHDTVRRGPASQAAVERLLRRKGVTRSSHLVLHGASGNEHAAYAFWLLRHLGHERLTLLDGGLAAWIASGGPVTAEVPPVRRVPPYRSSGPDPSLRATREQVLERYVDPGPGVLTLDCRSPAEFAGRAAHPFDTGLQRQRMAGRVPGARSLPVETLLDEQGAFRSRAELARIAAERGLTPASDVVVYCRAAERSALLWFALHELLGHPHVRHYDGGWAEYGSLVGVPVARGAV